MSSERPLNLIIGEPIPDFKLPKQIRMDLGIDYEEIEAFWLYWSPYGDEAMIMRFYKTGALMGGDTNWMSFLELEKLNPIMNQHNIGSSENQPQEALFCDPNSGNCWFIQFSLVEGLNPRGIHRLLQRLREAPNYSLLFPDRSTHTIEPVARFHTIAAMEGS